VAGNEDNLRDYWTKDPRGLAKWANHAHPWTALYNHLRKFLGDERAKRVAVRVVPPGQRPLARGENRQVDDQQVVSCGVDTWARRPL
jgi:hypothetical protein